MSGHRLRAKPVDAIEAILALASGNMDEGYADKLLASGPRKAAFDAG